MNRMMIIATTRPSIIPRLLLDWDGVKEQQEVVQYPC